MTLSKGSVRVYNPSQSIHRYHTLTRIDLSISSVVKLLGVCYNN